MSEHLPNEGLMVSIQKSLENIRETVAPMSDRSVDINATRQAARKLLADRGRSPAWFIESREANLVNNLTTAAMQQNRETPFLERPTDYRQQADVPQPVMVPQKLTLKSLRENYPGETSMEKLENLVLEQTQTWLDVAFIQAATQSELMQDKKISEVMETAKLFFGDGSRVEKILSIYQAKDRRNDLNTVLAASLGLIDLVLVSYLSKRIIEKKDAPMLIFLMLASIVPLIYPLLMAYFNWTDPEDSSRRSLARRYDRIQIPEEAKIAAEMAIGIQGQMKKLENTPYLEGVIKVLRELQTKTMEMELHTAKHRKMLEARANTGIKLTREKKPVRIEEFEDETVGVVISKRPQPLNQGQLAEFEAMAVEEAQASQKNSTRI